MYSPHIIGCKQSISRFYSLIFILSALLAGCGGGGSNTPAASSGQGTVSVTLPDSIFHNLPATGTLGATIAVNGGTPVAMTISSDNTTASATLNNIPTGDATIAITFTYDDNFTTPLVVASLEKTITLSTGDNSVSTLATDYITATFDEDNDGISNLVELDKNSVTSPFVSTCVLGTATLGNCEL